ncbi:MAG TPA: ABC transporter permease [Terriglobales bacterium]|nr:ABC transporter permease [Terriglobales bacterium]
MVFNILSFEFRQRLGRLSTYVYFLVFAGLGCLFTAVAGGAISQASVDFGTGGKVLVNSPFALNNIISFVTFFGIIVTAAIAGQATYQDVQNDSTSFFYTAPITKFDYLAGRYLGALAIQLVIFASVGLGVWTATHLPTIDPTRIGPQNVAAYFQPYFVLVIPNLIFITAIFFGLGALARKMLPVYAASAILLIGYFVAAQLSTDLTISVPAALADPLGANAIQRVTQYWTAFERNTRLIPLAGILLLNRLLWLGLGVAILAITYAKFRFSYPEQGQKKRKQVVAEDDAIAAPPRALPIAHPVFSAGASLRQFVSLTQIQFAETVKNVFFGVLLLAGGLFAIFSASGINNPLATPTYPVTAKMLEDGGGGFFIFALAIIIFYAGELAWRERDAKLNQIVDALPMQRWVLFASKLAALMLIQVLLVLVIWAAGLIVQIAHGYYQFEMGVYFKELFGIRLIRFWILCAFAMLVQTIVNHKYLGHFVVVLYFVSTIALPALGLQHYLYRFGQAPPFTYSDFNGFGPFVGPLFWFQLYWGIAAIAIAILSSLLWVRGTEGNWLVRLRLAAARLTTPAVAGLTACMLLFVGVGAYIFYNTDLLNPYRTTFRVDDARAQYEKKYRQYKELPQPKITDVNTQVDLYPEKRSAVIKGTMILENKTSSNIDRVALTVWPTDLIPVPMPHIQVRELALSDGQTPVMTDAALGFNPQGLPKPAPPRLGDGQTPIIQDPELGFYLYRLHKPLLPHGRTQLEFALEYDNYGFQNSNPNTDLVHNGTYIGERYSPFIGYAPDIELTDDSTRHKHGLRNTKRMPTLEDAAARNENMANTDADWINFDGTVSTSPDQIAILPGYLQKEWVQDGRRYFHYKMDAPILDLYSLNSGRYSIRRDKWRDVNLEIYYQPGHEFDLDRMMDGLKSSLEYCSTNFSPFQFRQERIIEFPRYQTFAASYANTIPFSEAIGFITYVDPKKPDAIDLPFYVTAHEVAHQWWAHQVISANVEGATSIVETLAQYSALMVMKHRYGPQSIRKFLRYEVDGYLRGRAQERNEEEPLYKVDVNQGYIHYNKGALVMYAIQDYIGEDKVSLALADFTKAYAFKGPPYPVSLDLIAYLKKYTPPEYQYLYDDLWENITLYDNRTISANYVQQPDGKYQVNLVVGAKKLRADGKGQEHAIPIHDWIDIGVLDSDGRYLYLQKQMIDKEQTQFALTVEKRPAQAGIDPLDKLIDRNPDDNLIKVKKQ